MITLDQATEDAFARREIRIEPILEIMADPSTGEWTQVPNDLILSRPVRSCSPVVSRTPVTRLEVEIAPTAAMKALFIEQRFIRYREIINGQPFDRFLGNLEKPEKGWDIGEGVLKEHIKGIAYSRSQRLKNLSWDKVFRATAVGPASGEWVAAAFMLYPYSYASYKRSAGNDPAGATQIFSPNIAGAYQATITLPDGTVKTAGTHFKIVVTAGTTLEVQWITGAPATDTAYMLRGYRVYGMVIPDSPTYGTTTTPSTPSHYKMYPAPDGEYDIPLVPQSNFAFKRYLSASKSKPVVYTRAGNGTGAPTEETDTDLFVFDYDRGHFTFTNNAGKAYIFAHQQELAADIMFVGVKELYWPDDTATANQMETQIEALYTDANVAVDLDPTLIGVKDYRLNGKGDTCLKDLLTGVAPNYIIHDAPDGYVRGRYFEQKATADLRLTQVKALRDLESPEFYTMVRVKSFIRTQEATQDRPLDLMGTFPNYDSTKWPNNWYMFDGLVSPRKSTPLTSDLPLYFAWKPQGNSNFLELPTEITVRGEGEFRFWRTLSYINLSLAGTGVSLPGESSREYVAGFERVIAKTSSTKTVVVPVGDTSKWAQGGLHPEAIVCEVRAHSTAVPAPFVVDLYSTVNVNTLGIACLTDESDLSLAEGAWGTKFVSPDSGHENYGDLRVHVCKTSTAVLQQWMLNFQSANTDDKAFYREWGRHKVLEIEEPSLSVYGACSLAQDYLTDIVTRSTAQEVDVLVEPAVELGDTVEIYDPTTDTTFRRLVVGWRDGNSFESPSMTLELADYSAYPAP